MTWRRNQGNRRARAVREISIAQLRSARAARSVVTELPSLRVRMPLLSVPMGVVLLPMPEVSDRLFRFMRSASVPFLFVPLFVPLFIPLFVPLVVPLLIPPLLCPWALEPSVDDRPVELGLVGVA